MVASLERGEYFSDPGQINGEMERARRAVGVCACVSLTEPSFENSIGLLSVREHVGSCAKDVSRETYFDF